VVFPVAVNPARPSPPLPRHAEHCDDISTLLECTGTRRRHDCHCAAYGPPVDGTLESARMAAERPTTTLPPLKPLLYEHRTRRDASTGAGFVRTAVSSVALLTTLQHVGKQCSTYVNSSLLGL
jgi:hypothetical protein